VVIAVKANSLDGPLIADQIASARKNATQQQPKWPGTAGMKSNDEIIVASDETHGGGLRQAAANICPANWARTVFLRGAWVLDLFTL
jgi:hypothetical protein